jgi:hypothetical protein
MREWQEVAVELYSAQERLRGEIAARCLLGLACRPEVAEVVFEQLWEVVTVAVGALSYCILVETTVARLVVSFVCSVMAARQLAAV